MNTILEYINNLINSIPVHDPMFLKLMYGVIAVSVFALIVSIIFLIYRAKDAGSIIGKLQKFNDSFYEEALRNVQKNKTTKTFYEYIDLLLSRSQIKYQFKFNFGSFIILSLLFFFFGLYSFIDFTDDYITSLVGGIGFGFIPYVFLEVMATIRGKQIKNQILTLIPILINNAKLTSGDVFLTIKRSIEKTREPMKIYLEEFVEEYESGVKIEKCFDNLKSKVMDYRFTRLIDCLEIHLYKGGNVIVTLNSIQKEYLAREIEEDRRKKENYSRVLGVYLCVASNIFLVYLVNIVMPEVIVELKKSSFKNNMLIAIISIIFSLIIAFKATRISSNSGRKK